MSVDQQFNTIYEKLQQLVKQQHRLQRENDRLREELQQARTGESAALQKADALQQQLTIMKMTTGDLSEKDKKDFEKKINQYIREIDKCISYLSQ